MAKIMGNGNFKGKIMPAPLLVGYSQTPVVNQTVYRLASFGADF